MNKGRKLNKCKVYNKIDDTTRLKLVKLVEIRKIKLKEASKILQINYSTVKTIMRLYRSENRILRKKKGGNLKKNSKKIKNLRIAKNKEIKVIEEIKRNKIEENSESSLHSVPNPIYFSGCSSVIETSKYCSESINDIDIIVEKSIEDSLLEDCIKIKLHHKTESLVNEIKFYFAEKCKLMNEINQNNFFIYNYMALQKLLKIHSVNK